MKITTHLALAALVCVLASPVIAQSDAEKSPNQRPQARQFRDRAQGGGGFPAMQAGRMAFLLERVLTEDQRASLRDAMEKQRDQMRPIEEKLRDARQDLLKASLAEKFDEEAVREKALVIGKLDADLTVLRAKAMSQMKPALSAEQIEKIKNPPPFEPGEFRRDMQRDDARPNARPRGQRDENDLPPKPKSEK